MKTPEEKATDEYQRALRARNSTKLKPNEREYKYCGHMVHWATLMAGAQPANALRWSREAAEWSKRLNVALDALYHDELAEINAKLEAFNEDAKRLKHLVS